MALAQAPAEGAGAAHYLWVFERRAGGDAEGGTEARLAAARVVAAAAADDLSPMVSSAMAGCYHEKQSLWQCGRHCLNNLLGAATFSSAELDQIAVSIGEMQGYAHPALSLTHRWPVVGNFDINVVLCALQQRGYEASWWDTRKPDAELLAALVSGGDAPCASGRSHTGEASGGEAEDGAERAAFDGVTSSDMGTCVGVLLNVRNRGMWTQDPPPSCVLADLNVTWRGVDVT